MARLFDAKGTLAKEVRSTPIIEGKQLGLFIFALVLAKINVLNFGIAKMVLKKPTRVSKFSTFDFAEA